MNARLGNFNVRATSSTLLPADSILSFSNFTQKDGMNDSWLTWPLEEHLPTRATIGVVELSNDMLIEGAISVAARLISVAQLKVPVAVDRCEYSFQR